MALLTREMLNRMRNLRDALKDPANVVGGMKLMTDAEFEFFCGAQQIVPAMIDALTLWGEEFGMFNTIKARDEARDEARVAKQEARALLEQRDSYKLALDEALTLLGNNVVSPVVEAQARAMRAEAARDAAIAQRDEAVKTSETWATRAMIAETQRDAAIRKFDQHVSRLEAILPARMTRSGNPIKVDPATYTQCHVCGALAVTKGICTNCDDGCES